MPILKIILFLISLPLSFGSFPFFQNKQPSLPSLLPPSLPPSLPPPPFEFSFKLLLPKNNSITSLDNIDDRMMINFILR
jgi:hypothetical protein